MDSSPATWDEIAAACEKEFPALAVELCRTYLARDPTNGFAWLIYGNNLTKLARYREARKAIREGRRHIPREKQRLVCAKMGEWCEVQGKLAAAANWYRKALGQDSPDEDRDAIYLGAVLARMGKLKEAERHCQDAIRRNGKSLDEAWLNLGLVLRAQGRYAEAVNCFAEALKLDPKYEDARIALKDVEQTATRRNL